MIICFFCIPPAEKYGMKLNMLNESGQGDPCPKCGKKLRLIKKAVGPGRKVERLKCSGLIPHFFKPERQLARSEPVLEPLSPSGSSKHTCRVQYRKPGDEAWARRNQRSCKACAAEYDASLDAGFVGDALSTDEVEELAQKKASRDAPAEFLAKLMTRDDPRRNHQAGKFGTGRVSGVKPDDSLMMTATKLWRDRNIDVDEATGIGKSRHFKDTCGKGHTCSSHPSGRPAWNYPMPDPVSTASTGKQRYNYMFKYTPTSTFEWPVSGMMGWEPKSEYEDYINSKLSCRVCNGKEEGCSNPVAQEYGQPKPFCPEHLKSSPYPSELLDKYGGEGLPGAPKDDYRDVEAAWRKTRAKHIQSGDKVKLNKMRGTVLEVDPEMEDRTHRVEWDNPKAEALRITWVDPERLDVVT